VEALVPAGREGELTPESVLGFWFGELTQEQWFRSTPELDAAMAARFGHALAAAREGAFDEWAGAPDGALALLLLLDQLPRNIHRNSALAFASDPKARAVARAAVAAGFDRQVPPERRGVFYLPFEHSEDMADQDRSVALFAALGEPVQLDYARRHRDVIARFGRFPHRNPWLGRESTAEEIAFLAGRDEPF
jgi:uncharacterized protein (DUF924 family)